MGSATRAGVAAVLGLCVLSGCYRRHELDRDAGMSADGAAAFAPCALEVGTGELILGGRSQPMVAHAYRGGPLLSGLVTSPHSDVHVHPSGCGHGWAGGALGSPDEAVVWLRQIWLREESAAGSSRRTLVPRYECNDFGCAEGSFEECFESGGCRDEHLSGALEIVIRGAGPRTFCTRLTSTAADGRDLVLVVHSPIDECD